MIVYMGDYDSEGLHQRIEVLSREVAGKLPPSGEHLDNLDVVLFSILNVLTEKVSGKHIAENKRAVVFNKKSTEDAYEILASNLKINPEFALALNRAWIRKLLDFLHAEATKYPKMSVDNFFFDVAETFRITTLLAARVLKFIRDSAAQRGESVQGCTTRTC